MLLTIVAFFSGAFLNRRRQVQQWRDHLPSLHYFQPTARLASFWECPRCQRAGQWPMNFVLGGHGNHDCPKDPAGALSKLQAHQPIFNAAQEQIPKD